MATKEQLAKIISERASVLCSVNGDQLIREKQALSNSEQSYGDLGPSNYGEMDDSWGTSELQHHQDKKDLTHESLDYSDSQVSNSSMPDAIKKSLMENKINVGSVDDVDGLGFLSKIKKKNQVKEQANDQLMQKRTQPLEVPQQPIIDYAFIRSIVKECINEALSQQSLNENLDLKQIHLKDGKIKLVDNSGNIYAAKLERVGNINDKKK